MKKATCLIISFLIFATPLFAIKEAIYNSKGVKIGYMDTVNGQKIFYDKFGNPTQNQSFKSMLMEELEFQSKYGKYSGEDPQLKQLDELNKQVDEWVKSPPPSSSKNNCCMTCYSCERQVTYGFKPFTGNPKCELCGEKKYSPSAWGSEMGLIYALCGVGIWAVISLLQGDFN